MVSVMANNSIFIIYYAVYAVYDFCLIAQPIQVADDLMLEWCGNICPANIDFFDNID
jgi:hypothetical protein